MRGFKFGIILCSMLIAVGSIGLGHSLGKLYNETDFIHDFNLNTPLDEQTLQKLYIHSDVPIRIEETIQNPHVAFTATTKGLNIDTDYYTLDVTTNGDTTHITLDKASDAFAFDEDEELVIYLPPQPLAYLAVAGTGPYWSNQLTYNGTIPINEFVVDTMSVVDLQLDGSYQKLDIDGNAGSLTLKSAAPAIVHIDGLYSIDLAGQYDSIDLSSSARASIYSETPANFTVRNRGTMDHLLLEGAFNTIDLALIDSDIEIIPSIEPKSIQLEGHDNDVTLKLTPDYTGFEVVYNKYPSDTYYTHSDDWDDWDSWDDDYRYYEPLEVYTNVHTERQPVGANNESLSYGDKATSIYVDGYENELSIIK